MPRTRRFARSSALLALLPALLPACEPPVTEPPPGRGLPQIPPSSVQNPAAEDHPLEGTRVLWDGAVISAVDDYDEDGEGRIGNLWVQEAGGGPWSGVQLFNPTVIPSRTRLVPGDVVRMMGTVDEFVLLNDDGTPMDRDGTLTEIVDGVAQKIGESLGPEPVVIRESVLADLRTAEPYEGVLVRLENVVFAAGYDRYGEATTEGRIDVANDLYEIPDLTPGTRLSSLTGVVTYFFGFKILPRGPEDVVRP